MNRIEEVEHPAPYLIDLMEFDGALGQIYEIIGFTPYWEHSDDARLALYGIAYRRGLASNDTPIKREEALQKLREHPEVEKRFHAEFPFICYET